MNTTQKAALIFDEPTFLDNVRTKGELPLAELPEDKRNVLLTSEVGTRVLYVEDCADTRFLLSHLLENVGFDVTDVSDAESCLRLFSAAPEHERLFDIVLIDIGLPDLDGFELSIKLRKCGFAGKIIALTGNELPNDWHESVLSGCDYFLLKSEVHSRLLPFLTNELN